jgi:hypothetical protein
MDQYIFMSLIVCCIGWMTRPGRRPHLFVLDLLPWLCVAASVGSAGALSAVLAWTAVPLVFFSVKYNHLDSLAAPQHANAALRGGRGSCRARAIGISVKTSGVAAAFPSASR